MPAFRTCAPNLDRNKLNMMPIQVDWGKWIFVEDDYYDAHPPKINDLVLLEHPEKSAFVMVKRISSIEGDNVKLYPITLVDVIRSTGRITIASQLFRFANGEPPTCKKHFGDPVKFYILDGFGLLHWCAVAMAGVL